MTLILSALILLASWADAGYTIWAVRRYRVQEANPIWRWAVTRPVVFVVASTALHGAVLWALIHYRATWEVFVAMLTIRAFVVWWNIYCIRRLK